MKIIKNSIERTFNVRGICQNWKNRYKQIQHINERRLGIYEKHKDNLKDIIKNPNYIIIDPKHDETGLVIKEYDKNVVVVLKLNTTEKDKKNSIITIWEIKHKRLERYLLTHKIIYKRE